MVSLTKVVFKHFGSQAIFRLLKITKAPNELLFTHSSIHNIHIVLEIKVRKVKHSLDLK